MSISKSLLKYQSFFKHVLFCKVLINRKIDLSPREHLERQLIDDAHRKDLTPLERAWAYATAIININTGGNYTIPQVKRMDRRRLLNLIDPPKTKAGDYDKGDMNELSRHIGVASSTIRDHLQILYLEPETQKMIGEGDY